MLDPRSQRGDFILLKSVQLLFDVLRLRKLGGGLVCALKRYEHLILLISHAVFDSLKHGFASLTL